MPAPRPLLPPRPGAGNALAAALALGAAGAAALAGCHPTGTPVLDPLYAALLAGAVTAAAARSPRGATLWLAVVAAALSRDWLLLPAAAGLLVAFAGTFRSASSPPLSALSAALAVEVVLRWPPVGFQGVTALIAAAAVLPVLVAGVMGFGRRVKLAVAAVAGLLAVVVAVFVVPEVVAAAASLHEVQQGTSADETALKQLSAGEADTAKLQLQTAQADFSDASARLGAWWTLGARAVPVVAQQRQALAVGVQVARNISGLARSEADRVDYSGLHYSGGGVNLGQVAALQHPLAVLESGLDQGDRRISTSRSSWLLQPLQSRLNRLDGALAKAQRTIGLAQQAVSTAPSLLGAHGVRHYFVAFLDPAESRGLGGLLVWYGVLTADHGHLSLSADGDATKIGPILAAHGGGKLSGLPQYVARYGRFQPQDTFIDAPYSPDLPTVTKVVSELYPQAGGSPIDGMLVLDPESLQTLLGVTGPLDVPGFGQMNGANTADLLLRRQYAIFPAADQRGARQAALDTALHEAASRLSGGSLPGARELASALGPDVKAGHLLFWSLHPADQALLYRVGLAGAFPPADHGDFLSVITQNAANNKMDAYLKRTIDDQVRFDPSTGRVSSTVRVTLANTGPASGLSSEVAGSYAGSGLASGTDLLWVSVYTPLQLDSASVDGTALAMGSTPEFGWHTYSGYVSVPAGQARTLVVNLNGTIARGTYRIGLHSQPMAIADRDSLEVSKVGGPAKRVEWVPQSGLDAFANFRF